MKRFADSPRPAEEHQVSDRLQDIDIDLPGISQPTCPQEN